MKIQLIDLTVSPLWRLITWKPVCGNPEHCKVIKEKLVRLIVRKFAANLKLSFVFDPESDPQITHHSKMLELSLKS